MLSSSTGWALMAGMVKVRSGVRVAMGDTGVSELEAMFGIYCLQVFARKFREADGCITVQLYTCMYVGR